MRTRSIAIRRAGLVTSVGHGAPQTCCALRAKIANPTLTRFRGASGEWITAHQVALERPYRGREKLLQMAARAADEALTGLSRIERRAVPLLLCVAELERPGRTPGLDASMLGALQNALHGGFHALSAVVPNGRVGVAVALDLARQILQRGESAEVLVVAADSLLAAPTLSHYDHCARLLTPANTDGFIPGEGAGAVLVGAPGRDDSLIVTGLGFARERAHIDAAIPLRADGLNEAIRSALADAGLDMQAMDYRITDAAGEQYYFKEAALAVARTLHVRKEEFDLWHPAECIGETGSVVGIGVLALAEAASRKGYGPGRSILAHFGNDAGDRAAMSLRYGSA